MLLGVYLPCTGLYRENVVLHMAIHSVYQSLPVWCLYAKIEHNERVRQYNPLKVSYKLIIDDDKFYGTDW